MEWTTYSEVEHARDRFIAASDADKLAMIEANYAPIADSAACLAEALRAIAREILAMKTPPTP